MMEFNSEYGKYYLNDDFYPIDVRSQRPLHRKVWLIETNKIRRDLGLKPLARIPKGFQIHHKDGCRTNFKYDNLQCVRWDKHCKHHQNRIRR